MSKKLFSDLSLDELKSKLDEYKTEMLSLRLKTATRNLTQKHLILQTRRNIARINTFIRMKQVANVSTN